jgi:hypothetical protein
MKYLKYVAIIGNVIYVLWILYNAIDEGFSASLVQAASGLGLVALLALNVILLMRTTRR